MKLYAIEQSDNEVKKAYSFLIDRINEHVKLLAENSRPFTSYIGIKRGLLKLRLGYLDTSCTMATEGKAIITLSEARMATEILEVLKIDVKPSVEVGLIGEREMKRQLVRYHYREMAKQDMTYKVIKEKLSKRYGLSVSAIEKLVYRPLRQAQGDKKLNSKTKNKQDG